MTPIIAEWDEVSPLILEQYKESPNFLGIIRLLTEQADRTEVGRWELSNLLDIDAMEGAQLDLLGKIGHCPRLQGSDLLDDPAYRIALKAAFRSRTSGTPEEIIEAVRTATGASQVIYLPEYPAGFWVFWDTEARLTQAFLESISPAGVLALIPCYLSLTTGELLETTTGESVLIVGPCDAADYPTDTTWDGGTGAVNPDAMTFVEPWPFRDGTGIGEQPDGGEGGIDPELYTFTDGTYAEDTGG